MLRSTVDLSGFRRLRDKTLNELAIGNAKAVTAGLRAGVEHARNSHPHQRRTGDLTSDEHLFYRIDRGFAHGTYGTLNNTSPYARAIEFGQRPHPIRPKEGAGFFGPLQAGQTRRARSDTGTHRIALRFEIGGRLYFRPFVNHPGANPFPFMGPAAQHAGETIRAEVVQVVFQIARIWA